MNGDVTEASAAEIGLVTAALISAAGTVGLKHYEFAERARQVLVALRRLAQRGPEGERYEVRIAADHLCRLRTGNAVRPVSVWTLGPASWLPEGHWTDVYIIVPPEGRAEGGDHETGVAVAPPASAQAGAGEVRR